MTLLEKIILLQGTDIFRQTRSEALAEVGAVAAEESFEKGALIFKEDEPADALYVLIAGQVGLRRSGQSIKQVGPREVFGDWAVFDGQPRIVTAVSEDPIRVLKILYEDFYDLLLDHMEIGRAVFKMLALQIRELTL